MGEGRPRAPPLIKVDDKLVSVKMAASSARSRRSYGKIGDCEQSKLTVAPDIIGS